MSTEPVYNPETYREKALRKFKQQPFVPIGALATTAALVIAMSKMRKGESKSLNTWLRVRVLAQGLTVGAIVLGSWTLGTGRAAQTHVQESAAAALEKVEAESAGFKARLREAEESHRVEDALRAGSTKGPEKAGAVQVANAAEKAKEDGKDAVSRPSWWSWRAWTGSRKEGSDKPS